MKQQEVFKKIGGIIREINEQYEYLETVDGVLNELELELMVANSHFLTDHIEILRKLNAHAATTPQPVPPVAEAQPAPAAGPVDEPRYFEPITTVKPAPEAEPITYLDETPPNTVEFEMPRPAQNHTGHSPAPEEVQAEEPEPEHEQLFEPETIRHELTMEDSGEDWDEEEEEIPAQQPEPAPVEAQPAPQPVTAAKPEPGLQAEPVMIKPEPQPAMKAPGPQAQPVAAPHTQIMVPEEQVLTFNQRMSAQLSTSRTSEHLSAPITDLKSAISLNDKLLYIKDLFNGYGLAYSEAIDTLNRFKTFEEAESFLKSTYSVKNNWQDKQATADQFYALLQRRYTPNP